MAISHGKRMTKKVKVEIYINRIILEYDGKQLVLEPDIPFTSRRLLVGDFSSASKCLEKGLKDIGASGFLKLLKPVLDIYPMEMSEGGLSEVENRLYKELGLGVQASKVNIHV
jgi:rod shape-determining protein MreB and related proteins